MAIVKRAGGATLALGLVAGGAVLLAASGASARERRPSANGRPLYERQREEIRDRFTRLLQGFGVDPGRLSEADWFVVYGAFSDMQIVSRLPAEEQGAALRASESFQAYIRMMMRLYGDDWRRITEAA